MKKTRLVFIILATVFDLWLSSSSWAAPYSAGKYNANIPYGSQTALSIATNGNTTIHLAPSSNGTQATGTSIVTVTSTDTVGYKLYVRSLTSTNMSNGAASLPASGNGSPAPLAVNTWGYNTNASSNFVGLSLTDTLVRSVSGPVSTGDPTTFTYGVKIDLSKPSGNYAATVLYTAAPQTN